MKVSDDRLPFDSNRLIGYVAGIVSGCTKLIVGHPFDTLKVRMQTEGTHGRFKGPLDCLLQTVGKEGPRALYKGGSPPLLGWMIMDSVMLGTLTNLKMWQSSDGTGTDLQLYQHGLAGFGAGTTVCLVSTPIELVKAQYDAPTNRYHGPLDCARQIIKNEGGIMRGLYRGFGASLLFRGNFWILWSSYEWYRCLFTQWHEYVPQSLVPFLSGGMAANTFWLIVFPVDVVKNRIMGQQLHRGNGEPAVTRLTILNCIKHVYRREGWRGFYSGFAPAMLRSFPTNGAAIFMFDRTMNLLQQYL